MKKILMFEAFSGIGAQTKAMNNIKKINKDFDFEVVGTSDWDVYANIIYSALHKGVSDDQIDYSIPYEEIISFLEEKVISVDGNNQYDPRKLQEYVARLLELSMRKSKNVGTIVDSIERYKKIIKNEIDIFTYSFPCQDLSSAGSLHGYNKGVNGKRSGLLFEIEKLLEGIPINKRPKTLLMENVHNLTNKRNFSDFENWIKKLEELGYTTFYSTIDSHVDAKSLQKRKRVFALSIKKYKGNKKDNSLLNLLNINNCFDKEKNVNITDIINFKSTKDLSKYKIRNTSSRIKMTSYPNFEILKTDSYTRTLTKKQDRWPNAGWISFENDDENYLSSRFISPLEATLLMEFDKKDYEIMDRTISKIVKNSKNKTDAFKTSKIYQVTGNSIVVGVLEAIFKLIIKEIDNGKF